MFDGGKIGFQVVANEVDIGFVWEWAKWAGKRTALDVEDASECGAVVEGR